MKKFNIILSKFNIVLIILLVVSFCINFYYSDKVSTAGESFSEVEAELKVQKLLNEELENEYLYHTSLTNVYQSVLEEEYVEAEYEYYQIPEFALR